MREVIGAASERTWHDSRFDAPQRQLTGVLYGQRVHARFRREVWREIGWCAARRTAARHPDEQPLALLPHLRQYGAVHSLCAQDIDVVELSQLLRRKRFRGAKNHVAGIMDEDVEPAMVGDNRPKRVFD
jgi:hypothetical protein